MIEPHDSSGLADIRHDLLSPLNQILGYSEMLIEELRVAAKPDGLISEMLQAIRRSGREVLEAMNERFPPQCIHTGVDFARLTLGLEPPLTRITALSRELDAAAVAHGDAQLQSDAQKIGAGASGLLDYARGLGARGSTA